MTGGIGSADSILISTSISTLTSVRAALRPRAARASSGPSAFLRR